MYSPKPDRPDPFKPPPPVDAEVLMEAALRRKGMVFGIIVAVIGLVAVLLGLVMMTTKKKWSGAVYTIGFGISGMLWGTRHFFKFHGREY